MELPPEFEYYLDPVNITPEKLFEGKSGDTLEDAVVFYDGDTDIGNFDVAIIGVRESVNSPGNSGCAVAPDHIREKLYGLSKPENDIRIIDLGNIRGRSAKDKFVALEEICTFLIGAKVVPVVLGGSQDLTVSMAAALNSFENKWAVTLIDPKIDHSGTESDFTSANFLGRLLKEGKDKINDVTLMGIQKYFCSSSQMKFTSDNFFNTIRLGELKGDGLLKAEPYIRDTDLLSIDASAVKSTDMPSQKGAMPNGLLSNEICQLAWYAGLSDRLKAFGLFEVNPENDNGSSAGVALSSQIVWHFIDGVSMRYDDYPVKDIESYNIYIVHLDDYGMDIRFFNNSVNGRWWVEVPGDDEKSIISCNEDDYKKSVNNEIPEKWIFSLKKSVYKSGNKNNNLSNADEK